MTAKFSILTVAVTPIASIALACGGDDDGGGGIKVVDASMGSQTIDAPPSVDCYIESSLAPTFGSADQLAEENGSGFMNSNAHTQLWAGRVAAGPPDDIMQIELYAGFAAFAGADISPKTIQLAGDELNYRTCGACVRIFADATEQATAAQYFATGGTLTLTSTTGNLTGTLTNVTLTKVTIAQDFTSTPVGDGCNTSIANMSFDAPITMGSAVGVTGTIENGPLVLRNRKL